MQSSTLFVSFSKRGINYALDASVRYRCIFKAEQLRSRGNQADIIHIRDIRKIHLPDYTTVICHRPFWCRELSYLFRHGTRLRLKLLADYDDQLFRPDLAADSPTVQNDRESLQTARRQSKLSRKALRKFAHCQMSTTHLIDSAMKVHHLCDYEFVPNTLPSYWVDMYAAVEPLERLQQKIIRYFPGTANHTANFVLVENFLSQWLGQNPDVILEVVGNIRINTDKFKPHQLRQRAFVDFNLLPTLIRDSWVTIAPLDKNSFNECKSGLKFWESGVFGVPVIACNNTDMERFRNDGLLLSANTRDWEEFLEHLKVPDNYCSACSAAHRAAMSAVIPTPPENFSLSQQAGIPSLNATNALMAADNTNPVISIHHRRFKKLLRDPRRFWRDSKLRKLTSRSSQQQKG
ncbi:hypothetical protein [Oceanobacter mangrovi]|uniref:hypothetical protein n=1 Tax=Oceanobacter mangrovi TaxID=2862510 RepID=UPI001C8E87A0|nr:hypothetical protein [Oceanobacter mangrovi]